MKYYVLKVKKGSELVTHEVFLKSRSARRLSSENSDPKIKGLLINPFKAAYTPVEHKTMGHASRKAKKLRKPPMSFVEAVFDSYLFVGTDMNETDALMSMQYIIDRRRDVYRVVLNNGAPFTMTQTQIDTWKANLIADHKNQFTRKNYEFGSGYDYKLHKRKSQAQSYGEDIIEIPSFSLEDKVKFNSGGFEGVSADVVGVSDEFITVLASFFSSSREIKVDPYELKKVG